MGTVILVVLGIILGAALLGFLFSKDGEREEAAKTGAMFGGTFILGLLPTVIVIVFVVLIVRACT